MNCFSHRCARARTRSPSSLVATVSILIAFGSGVTRAEPVRADADVTAAIHGQFLRDATLSPLALEIVTHDGVASLDGEVGTLLARRHAAEVAESVRGVSAVVNRITVMPSGRTAGEIADAVEGELESNPATDLYEISARADDRGHVTLSGTVDSHAERDLAERVAMMARGVSSITNDIVVETAEGHRAETDIRHDIEERLRWDTLVDDSLISVLALQGGRVTLSGTVGSAAEKKRAEADAWVAGVRTVDIEHLEVEPWATDEDLRLGKYGHREDGAIRDAIIQALSYDPRVLDEQIDVTVHAGRARLLGEVGNLQAKRAAAQDASNTVGVKAVDNELAVVPEPVGDPALEESIADALRGAGLLEGNSISVAAENGVVTLSGDVTTTPAYWHAEQLARNARGAADVRNELTVDGRARIRTAYAYGFYPTMIYANSKFADEPLPTDREIHADVESELFWSPFVDEDAISVSVDNGTVTLAGEVASLRELEIARDNALEGGAIEVQNELVVNND